MRPACAVARGATRGPRCPAEWAPAPTPRASRASRRAVVLAARDARVCVCERSGRSSMSARAADHDPRWRRAWRCGVPRREKALLLVLFSLFGRGDSRALADGDGGASSPGAGSVGVSFHFCVCVLCVGRSSGFGSTRSTSRSASTSSRAARSVAARGAADRESPPRREPELERETTRESARESRVAPSGSPVPSPRAPRCAPPPQLSGAPRPSKRGTRTHLEPPPRPRLSPFRLAPRQRAASATSNVGAATLMIYRDSHETSRIFRCISRKARPSSRRSASSSSSWCVAAAVAVALPARLCRCRALAETRRPRAFAMRWRSRCAARRGAARTRSLALHLPRMTRHSHYASSHADETARLIASLASSVTVLQSSCEP